jgi:uncharacterized protein (DUF4415 family)
MAGTAPKKGGVANRPASTKATEKGVSTARVVTTAHEKEKLSLTLDKSIVREIRTLSGGRPLSTSINELLRDALAQHRLGELVAEMQESAGPVTSQDYERAFSQWFEQD